MNRKQKKRVRSLGWNVTRNRAERRPYGRVSRRYYLNTTPNTQARLSVDIEEYR